MVLPAGARYDIAMHKTRILAVLLLGFMLSGIGCTARGNFDVVVRNDTTEPLSAGFIKAGGPMDPKWTTPAEITILSPQLTDRHWGTLVPAGKAVRIAASSSFSPGSAAFIRIYAGDLLVNELVAISPGNPDMVQRPLDNGQTIVVVKRMDGQLHIQSVGAR